MHQPATPPTAAPQQLPSLSAYAMLEEQKQTFASALVNKQQATTDNNLCLHKNQKFKRSN